MGIDCISTYFEHLKFQFLNKIDFFQKIESGVLFFTGVLDFLEATAGFLATWHHVC